MEQIEVFRKSEAGRLWEHKFQKTYPFLPADQLMRKTGMTQQEFMQKHGGIMLIGITEAYCRRIEWFRKRGCDPLLIYSLWEGYIERDADGRPGRHYKEGLGDFFWSWPENRRVVLHTGGHAALSDTAEMIRLTDPKEAILPIHTEQPRTLEALGLGKKLEDKIRYPEDGKVCFRF